MKVNESRMQVVGKNKQGKGGNLKARVFAIPHSADHKCLMTLLRMIMREVDIGTEAVTISEQEVNTQMQRG